MKKFVTVAMLLLLAGNAVAAPLGMAQAGSAYQVVRAQESLSVEPQTPVSISTNDKIVAQLANVRVRLLNGDLLVVGKDSSATMLDQNTVQIHQGQALVAAKPGSTTEISFHDLTVSPLVSEQTASKERTFAVNALDENTLQIANYSESFLTVTTAAGEQLALVTNKDVISLVRGENGKWAVTAIPMLTLQGQESNAEDPASTPPTEEDDGDRDEAIAWWWFPVGAAAVAGAGVGAYYLIEDEDILDDDVRETFGGDDDDDEGDDDDDDDDDDDGDDRPTRSPIDDGDTDEEVPVR